ncbi:glycerophosphodiester phosphodiesterase family protein [Maribellus sp. YY47]|uniref:glycerophosphodiester phosphodiesterase family protein n=1 Tax=Maribellus sp. YY47 TaxID=2929486 RepID=UPI00200173A4|nr:glycerophosphodiester phosphodiesterase family protein [Maribellus sp. YY47]MCK3684735.1 glycerophosphodiester phosphodiesterase family protein [Maribellus sp. YY47]
MKTAIAFALVQLLLGCQFSNKPTNVAGETKASTPELSDYFRYKEGGDIIVSGHRGGRLPGLPENSLEIYQYVAGNMPVIFEIDPRLTKDSVIVVHHDATLDRTTTGTGKLNGYTCQELLDSVKLKDHEGNSTSFNVPMLKDVMVWAKGKTVLNLDKKDVPPAMVVSLIKEMGAEDYMMVTVHNGEQAKYYYEQLPGVMQSVFIRNNEEYESFVGSGVPWHNIIAYVGKTIDENNAELVKKLHEHGVRCMVSFAPTHDKLQDEDARKQEYQKELLTNPDIIESDLPLEVWAVLQSK